MVQGRFLSDLLKPFDPVVGVILLSLSFLCRGLAQFLADRPQAETLLGVKLDSYLFCASFSIRGGEGSAHTGSGKNFLPKFDCIAALDQEG